MVTPNGDLSPNLSPPPEHSSFQIQHTERRVRQLVILEDELEDLSGLDSLTTFCLGISSFCLSFALSVYTLRQVQDQLSSNAEGFTYFALRAALALGTLFALGGFIMWRQRKSKFSKIKDQLYNKPQSGAAGPSAPTE
jgi:hypothetical protein